MLAPDVYSCHCNSVETVVDRLRSAMTDAGLDKHGGAAALCRASGVTPPTLSRILNEPGKQPESDTIKKLADALGVQFEWLAYGTGPRKSARTFERDEQYPARAKAIEAARLLRTASEEAIESVCSWTDRKDAQGWTEQDWYDELLTEDRRRRRGRVEPTRSFVDEVPPGVKKGKRR